tara:strand:+ start:298 stop:471 length:174 start_codon:yes stop_codon:yes gene_type:complete
MNPFKFLKRKPAKPIDEPKKKFNHQVRKDSENMSDKEKMDKGFNGSTYSINGRDVDF